MVCWQLEPFVNSPRQPSPMAEQKYACSSVNPDQQLASFLPSIVVKSLSINQLEEQTPAQFIIIFLQVIRGSNKAAGVDTFSHKSICQKTCMFLSNPIQLREREGEGGGG